MSRSATFEESLSVIQSLIGTEVAGASSVNGIPTSMIAGHLRKAVGADSEMTKIDPDALAVGFQAEPPNGGVLGIYFLSPKLFTSCEIEDGLMHMRFEHGDVRFFSGNIA
jgi:hypothetical protein